MLSQLFAYVGRVVHTGLKLIEQTVKTWTKPNTATAVINALADMTRTKPELIAENALLRQQLIVLHLSVKRPKFTASVRWLMVLLAGQVRYWKQALLVVQPDTLLRWHRDLFRWVWQRKSQATPGRQQIADSGIEQQVPNRPIPSLSNRYGKVISLPVLGGLHHRYTWAA
jgi:putative transposase